ncbi:hypothetical protein [Vreelandella rituensis]|nr:hypothetical protein [Halomonas rituensis]
MSNSLTREDPGVLLQPDPLPDGVHPNQLSFRQPMRIDSANIK